MAAGDRGPDGVGLVRGDERERDRVARGGDGRHDLSVEALLAPRPSLRRDREGLQPRLEEADRPVVTRALVHRTPEDRTPRTGRLLPA